MHNKSFCYNHKDIAFDVVVGACQYAFSLAYKWPYLISIAFGAVCIIASLFLRDIREHLNEQMDMSAVDRAMEGRLPARRSAEGRKSAEGIVDA